ncbi:MAG: hypothetical protein A2W29_09780 [Gemmatimonadetes bacterium RBG_16_66_8]|nr:MAG: hypothetical protein A2W29_09780 [Gemmatimonadetes bacterium RBG_16_66_8]
MTFAGGATNAKAVGPRWPHAGGLRNGWPGSGATPDRFPGQGLTLVHAALRSPSFLNRTAAVDTLAAWGESRWGRETRALLEAARESEPDERLRERMGRLPSGESTDLQARPPTPHGKA